MGDDDTGVDKIIMTRNRTIMLTCLYLEGVAVCAKVCGWVLGLLSTVCINANALLGDWISISQS